MKWIAIGLIILFLLLLIIILSRLTIYITFQHAKDNDSFKIKFRAWFGLIRYTLDIPLIKIDEDTASIVTEEEIKTGTGVKNKKRSQFFAEDFLQGFKDTEKLLKHVVSLHKIIRKFLRKVSIKRLQWHTVIGVGEASLTGMLTGAIWTVKGGIIGVISHYFKLKINPTLSVHPHFQMPVSQTSFECMLQFRIGHAIFAGIKLFKYWKGGRPQFRSKLLSNLSHQKTKTV